MSQVSSIPASNHNKKDLPLAPVGVVLSLPIRDPTELQRTGPLVLFWFFHVIDLKNFVIAMKSFYFRFFACIKNTAKHTATRRSRTLARSVR